MSQKEKWVHLFKQVVGRPPTAAEFQRGIETNFDFKAIKQIAESSMPQTEEVEQVVPQSVVESVEQGLPPLPAKPKKRKLLALFIGLGVLLIGLGGLGFLGYSQTKPATKTQELLSAVTKKDYTTVAELLSDTGQKWNKKEAKAFVTYLKDQETSLKDMFKQVETSAGRSVYTDEQGNKLIGLVEKGKKWLIFPDYAFRTYPLQVRVTSNLSDVEIDGKGLAKGETSMVLSLPFISQALTVTGSSDLGKVETEIVIDPKDAQDNLLELPLEMAEYELQVQLPVDRSTVEKVELWINDKKVSESLEATVQALDFEMVKVKAKFTVKGQTFETKSSKNLVSIDEPITLTLDPEVDKRLKKLLEKKEESPQIQARWDENKAQRLAEFMVDWGNSMDQPGYENWGANGGVLFWQDEPLDAAYSATGVSKAQYTIVAVYSYNRGEGLRHTYHFAILPDGSTTIIYSERSFGSGYLVSKLQTGNADLLNAFAQIVNP